MTLERLKIIDLLLGMAVDLPELRVGQIIGGALQIDGKAVDPFYVSDAELSEALRHYSNSVEYPR